MPRDHIEAVSSQPMIDSVGRRHRATTKTPALAAQRLNLPAGRSPQPV